VLLYRILLDLGLPGAWLAAALWALHPIQVESVAWITERKNVLSGALYLGSLWCWIRALGLTRAGPADAARSTSTAIGGAVLYVAALLSKTVTSVLPITLAILIGWSRRGPTRRQGAYVGAMLAAGAMMGALTSWLERHQVGAQGEAWSLDAVERIAVAGRAWWFYLGKLLWPVDLTFIYPRWDVAASGIWLVWPLAVVATLLVLFAARGGLGRGPLAAALHYTAALVPALGFINVYPMRYAFVADHFQYLAGIGPIVALSALAARLAPRIPRAAAVVLVAVVLATLGGMTWQRGQVFESREVLWRDTLRRNPAAWIAHNNLGILEAEAGNSAAAAGHFGRVVELRPGHAGARNNLGWLRLREGNVAAALQHLAEAVRLAPDDLNARVNLGNARRAAGDPAGAEASYREALRIEPLDPRALGSLGDLLLAQRRWADAVRTLERLRQALPTDPGVRGALAAARRQLARERSARPPAQERD